MKRAVAGLLSLVFTANFVSAASIADSMTGFVDSFVKVIEPLARQLLGGGAGLTGELLFARVLFFLIVFGIVWVALSRVGFFAEYTWVLVVVSLATSLLSIRFVIEDNLIRSMVLPYSALGIALTAGFPFALYFLVVNIGMAGISSFARKAAWIFFGVIFLFLWFSRYDELVTNSSSAGWVYPVTAILATIMAFADGSVSRWLAHAEMNKAGQANVEAARIDIRRRIAQLNRDLTDQTITASEHDRMIRDLRKRLVVLEKA
ncbi:MAG: hypothetical protein Q8L29_01055 [archaeon]|nr:hypothetical protein [archaeon]